MNFEFTIYSAFFLAITSLSFIIAILAMRRLSVKGAKELMLLMISAGIWSFWIIFETGATTAVEKIFWSKFEYIGSISAPVFYFIFVSRYTGKLKFISAKHFILLFIIPLITLILVITNEKHLLVWSGFSNISTTANIMEYYHGIWFWIGYLGYNYLLFLLATIFLFNFIIHQKRTFRLQGSIILLASACPWVASIFYLTGFNPIPGLDFTPVSIILSGTLLVLAILYIRFLDIVPIAHKTLFETIPDGIIALDSKNRVQDINEAAFLFLGIRNKDVIGYPLELSDVSDSQLLQAAIDTELISQVEIRKEEVTRTFRIIKKPIKNHSGSRLIIIQDITELKIAEQALKESEGQFKNMFTMHNAIMLLIEPVGGQIIDANQSASDFYGYSIPQLKSMSINDINTLSPEETADVRKQIAGKKQNHFVFIHKLANGELHFVDVYSSLIVYERRKIIFAIMHDITDRKKAEQALKESEAKSSAILGVLPDMMFIQNLQGVFIDFYVPKTAASCNPRKVFLGQKIENVLPEDVVNRFIPIFKEAIETKRMQFYEYSLMMPDKIHFYEARTISLDNDKVLSIVRDITDRKEVEQTLHWNQSLMQLMSNASPLGFLVVDNQDDDILYFNQRFCQIWNIQHLSDQISKSELKNNDIVTYYLKLLVDGPSFVQTFRLLQNVSNRIIFEDELKFNDGKTIRLYSTQIRGEHDEYYGRFYIFEDITERKLSENVIKQTRKNYETFFNTIDDFLFVLDELGNIIHTNKTVINRLGYKKGELYGKSVLLLYSSQRREEARQIINEILLGSEVNCPVPLVSKSGDVIAVETKVTKGEWNGKPVIFFVTKDISQIKLSEEKFSKAFHSNSALMAMSNIDDGKFIDVNPAFLETLGYTNNEVIGHTSEELNLFVNTETRNNLIEILKNQNSQNQIEIEIRTKDGNIKSGYLSAEKIYIGHEFCLLTTMIDITYRKEAEQIIKLQNQELKKLNTDKDRFISILAHDLKNPLSTLMSFSELLANNIHNYQIDEIENFLKLINNSAHTTYNLLIDTLTWARSQAGKILFEPHNLNFKEICKKILEDFKINTNDKDIKVNLYSHEEIIIFADKNMLNTILRNLISNAIKFTKNGGKIDINEKQTNSEITISISDSGVGIEPEIIERLFDISQIYSTKGTSDESGTGLGLLLCKEFVEKHGGKIWVESEPGKGSIFYFTIPCPKIKQ